MNRLRVRLSFITEVKACLYLAVPLAGAQLTQAATAFADTVMMGWLGSQTLAAGGLGAVTFSALLMIITGVVSAVSPLVAEAYGAGKTARVGQVVAQGFWLSLALAIPSMFLVWHAGPILRQLGQIESNVVIAQTYLRAIVWGLFPALIFAVCKNFVAALSKPRPIMAIMICGTLCNIAANYCLMFGKLGLPALGLAGIGWASTLSYWLMTLAIAAYILSQKTLRAHEIVQQLSRLNYPILKELVQTGWPISALFAVEAGLFTVTTFLMGQLGVTTLAAHQIALQTAAFTFMVPVGISYATTIRVGQLVGQGDLKGARLAGYVGIGLGAAFMAMMALLFWTRPEAVVSLYLDIQNPDNQEVVQLATALLGVAAMFQMVDGIQSIAAGALRGLKDTYIPMLIGLFAYWGVGFTSGYFLSIRLQQGGVGLWWGLAIGLAMAAITLFWRFHSLISAQITAATTSLEQS